MDWKSTKSQLKEKKSYWQDLQRRREWLEVGVSWIAVRVLVIVLMALHSPAPNISGEEVRILWTGGCGLEILEAHTNDFNERCSYGSWESPHGGELGVKFRGMNFHSAQAQTRCFRENEWDGDRLRSLPNFKGNSQIAESLWDSWEVPLEPLI